MGVEFVQEFKVGRYSIDFALKKFKIAIECDGRYWHSDPTGDDRKTAFLEKNGWKVVRLSEGVINNASDLRSVIRQRVERVTGRQLVGP